MLTSLPPQGSGVPLIGWAWSDVPWHESAGGTTWADVTVTGELVDGSLVVDGVHPFERRRREMPVLPDCDDATGDGSVPFGDEQEALRTMLDTDDAVIFVWKQRDRHQLNVFVAPGERERIVSLARRSWAGLLCVEERDLPRRRELDDIKDELFLELRAGSPLDGPRTGHPVPHRGYVELEIVAVTPEAEAYARDRWGDAVRLVGFLEPID